MSVKCWKVRDQDGFQIYLHTFIVTDKGNWAVIQQGMNDGNGMALRSRWCRLPPGREYMPYSLLSPRPEVCVCMLFDELVVITIVPPSMCMCMVPGSMFMFIVITL